MKNLLIVATGGTIACNNVENNRTPTLTGNNILDYVGDYSDKCTIKVLDLMQIDSSEMLAQHRKLLAESIRENADLYDGFIVLHGTDTMCYTSALLTYLLYDINKPIVITGAQKPIENNDSDGILNVECAITAALSGYQGVCIAWREEIIDGACASKVRTDGFYTIKSINQPNAGLIDANSNIKFHSKSNIYRVKPMSDELNTNFVVLKLFPDINPDLLDNFISCDAVIIEGFGCGGLPSILLPKIENLIKQDVKVYIKSQTTFGGADLSAYENSAKAQTAGAIDLGKLTLENICARIMCNIID